MKTNLLIVWLQPRGRYDLGGRRRAKVQCGEGHARVVDAHVAHSASAEVFPSPPREGAICRMIGPRRRHAQPEVPVQAASNNGPVRRPVNALRPPARRPLGPDVQLGDFSQHSRPDDLDPRAWAVTGHALGAYLGGQLVFPGDLGHELLARLPHYGARNRLKIRVRSIFQSLCGWLRSQVFTGRMISVGTPSASYRTL